MHKLTSEDLAAAKRLGYQVYEVDECGTHYSMSCAADFDKVKTEDMYVKDFDVIAELDLQIDKLADSYRPGWSHKSNFHCVELLNSLCADRAALYAPIAGAKDKRTFAEWYGTYEEAN